MDRHKCADVPLVLRTPSTKSPEPISKRVQMRWSTLSIILCSHRSQECILVSSVLCGGLEGIVLLGRRLRRRVKGSVGLLRRHVGEQADAEVLAVAARALAVGGDGSDGCQQREHQREHRRVGAERTVVGGRRCETQCRQRNLQLGAAVGALRI
eukprot:1950787-Pleurochrysis_carterae.AAC.2